jgi:hypothetical protein
VKLLLLISFISCAYSAQGQQPVQLPDDLRSKVDSVLSQYSRGGEIQNEIKQKFGKIPLVFDDKDLEKGMDGSVLFFLNKPTILSDHLFHPKCGRWFLFFLTFSNFVRVSANAGHSFGPLK